MALLDDVEHKSPPLLKYRRRIGIVLAVVVIVIFVVGFLIGFFSAPRGSKHGPEHGSSKPEEQVAYTDRMTDSLRAQNLENFLREFTKRPHMGGTDENRKLGEYIRDLWLSYGFDKVEMPRYDVLLSIPPRDKPNAVKIIDERTGGVILDVQGPEKIAEPSENDTLVAPPFLAYAPAGHVTGDLLYVNYGSTQDFAKLRDMNLTCDDKIVILRYGKIFRGDKVKNAERCGAKGVLIYSDPADYVAAGAGTFPDTWWLPPSGAQRGTIYANNGDPLTPDLPATDGIYRIPFNKTKGIPGIPAQAMTYGDAVHFLSRMGGAEVPDGWSGRLNITYRLGPGFRDTNLRVRLEVNNEFVTRSAYNVIGTIRGAVEPDRIVMIGNHRDAWVFGGVDPSSGSAVMMEVARGFGKLMKETGWRPRRTIMFCSWGVEEYGLIGSVEWVEENQKTLADRAVVHINLDTAVKGNYSFSASGSPLLAESIFKATAKTTDHSKTHTVYDTWKRLRPAPGGNKPILGTLGSGSDHAHFAYFVGIPSIEMSYGFYSHGIYGYPVYHSVHDTFYWQKKFNDPHFLNFLTMAQVSGRLVMDFSEPALLPFEFGQYKETLLSGIKALDKSYGDRLKEKNITLEYVKDAIETLEEAMTKFTAQKQQASTTEDFVKLRMLNDQMMLFERSFIWPYGLPRRPDTRHVIFAPEMHNQYGSSMFPAIGDTLFDIEKTGDWDLVKKQVSIITHSIRSAALVLRVI
ncbi:glutamate carboxypeptidase 2-like [Nematostella vectensis]|uniref:glutamate carboxypeptidase 2-like n=1 Tax=Nematostella vectensis TaxID=45351 RepID=UPI00207789A1|nr:glutamate carboxypeptidase 2-like [Nematostella vectensis]